MLTKLGMTFDGDRGWQEILQFMGLVHASSDDSNLASQLMSSTLSVVQRSTFLPDLCQVPYQRS